MPILLDCGATIAAPGDLPGALITQPRQIEFAGLLLGAGTPFIWKNLTGWDDELGVDLSDSRKDTGDGDYPGPGWRQSRVVNLDVQVHGLTVAYTEQLARLLRDRLKFRDAEVPLTIRDSGRTLWTPARVIARSVPHAPTRTVGIIDATVQWKATDVRQYAPTRRTASLVPSAGSGGVGYPVTYPVDYGTPSGAGAVTVTNAGDEPAPAVVVMRGPSTTVPYGVVVGGRWLRMDLPLAAGDVIRADTRDGSIVLNGNADRTDWLNATSVPVESWLIPSGESTVEALGVSVVDLDWADTTK